MRGRSLGRCFCSSAGWVRGMEGVRPRLMGVGRGREEEGEGEGEEEETATQPPSLERTGEAFMERPEDERRERDGRDRWNEGRGEGRKRGRSGRSE